MKKNLAQRKFGAIGYKLKPHQIYLPAAPNQIYIKFL